MLFFARSHQEQLTATRFRQTAEYGTLQIRSANIVQLSLNLLRLLRCDSTHLNKQFIVKGVQFYVVQNSGNGVSVAEQKDNYLAMLNGFGRRMANMSTLGR